MSELESSTPIRDSPSSHEPNRVRPSDPPAFAAELITRLEKCRDGLSRAQQHRASKYSGEPEALEYPEGLTPVEFRQSRKKRAKQYIANLGKETPPYGDCPHPEDDEARRKYPQSPRSPLTPPESLPSRSSQVSLDATTAPLVPPSIQSHTSKRKRQDDFDASADPSTVTKRPRR